MKITVVTPIFPPEIGGPATYTSTLANKLAKEHRVSVIAFSPFKPPATSNQYSTHFIPTTGNFLTRQLSLAYAVWKNALSTDLMYIQGTLVVGFTAAIIGRLLGKKVILKFVGDEYWELARRSGITAASLENFYQHTHFSIHVLLHRLALKLTHQVVVPSNYLKNFLVSAHNLNSSKIAVIPNAIDIPKFTPIKKIPHQLIFVGRLVSWKNVDQIIKAVSIARKTQPWKLVIIGEGPEKTALPKADWILYLGTKTHTETLKHIAASQKVILYSTYEGQPHTLIEAMKLKTAIIASDIQPNKEILSGYGQLVPLNQPKKLAEAINASQTHLDAPEKLIDDVFTWKHHITTLLKYF